MTCAGISSLILSGSRRYESLEHLQGETIRDCGKGGYNASLARGIDWLANHFDVTTELRQRSAMEILLPVCTRASRPA